MQRINRRLFSWASVVEDSTLAQVELASRMPFIHPHIALTPDAHLGKGCAVGAVLPTLGAIMPAAVGVDIGCGMIAVRTQFSAADLPSDRSPLRRAIEAAVPLSAGGYNDDVTLEHTERRLDELTTAATRAGFDPASVSGNWHLQLGSLGSGNHFIEVSLDEDDRVWLFLHSGSRGVGNRIATRHIAVAQAQCRKRWIELPDPDLAYLVEGDDEFWAYIRQLRWAQRFALLNRAEMMDRVVTCVAQWTGQEVEETGLVNCHHNYIEQEQHFGKTVWVSRKGAINAEAGRPGLVPGSMGTASYVVVGKGNGLALNSSPHGAGRRYGRREARRTFTYDQLVEAMDGIEWSGAQDFLDEIPSAYKDVDTVMEDAADLVEIRHTLRQIVNVKGS